MTISQLLIRVFGGLTNRSMSFAGGVNIVLGPNETGKSTVFRALGHSILTRTNLDKRTFERDLSSLLPRPSGNALETELTIDAGGEYLVKKQWGTAPSEEVRTPDGAIVRGSDEVAELIGRLVPIGLGSFRTVFLADQSQLDQTLAELRDSEARDDAASVLRQAAFDTGGVSVDRFSRRLAQRIDELLGRWDSSVERPDGGRSYLNPWKQRAGLVVNAFYELQRADAELLDAESAERDLDRAASDLEHAAEMIRDGRGFLDSHGGAYQQLRESRGVEGQIEAAQERLRRLREVNRRWPVVESDLSSITTILAGLRDQTQLAEERAAKEDLFSGASDVVGRHDRLLKLSAERDAQRAAIERMPAPTTSEIATLRDIDSRIAASEARMTAGTLRVSVASDIERDVTVRIDGGQETTQAVGPGSPGEISASRQVEVNADDLVLVAEAGEENFDELAAQQNELREERRSLLQELHLASTAAAEQAIADLRETAAGLTRLEDQIDDLLGSLDEAEFNAKAENARQLLTEATQGGNAVSGASPDVVDATASPADLREQMGAANARVEQLTNELARIGEEYQSQDHLEDQLGAAKLSLAELEKKLSGVELPEGFDTVDQFLAEYEAKKTELDRGSEEYTAARVSYAELLGRQPEQSSEELATVRDDAKATFERAQRSGRAVLRLRDRAQSIVKELDDGTFGPYDDRVGHYISVMTNQTYVAEGRDEDPLLPSSFERSNGPGLPYALLSHGTQDSIALSIRLALAETLLAGEVAPLLLDDPLVDLDAERRDGAARAIAEFAANRQVILFTCHPEHAALFPDANVMEMAQ